MSAVKKIAVSSIYIRGSTKVLKVQVNSAQENVSTSAQWSFTIIFYFQLMKFAKFVVDISTPAAALIYSCGTLHSQ